MKECRCDLCVLLLNECLASLACQTISQMMLTHFFLRPVLVGCPLKIGHMYCQNNEFATMTPNIIRPLLLPSSSDTATSESASNTLGKTALEDGRPGRQLLEDGADLPNGKSTHLVAKFALRVICTAAGGVASGVVGMSRAQSGSERSASIANKGGRTDRGGAGLWRVVCSCQVDVSSL